MRNRVSPTVDLPSMPIEVSRVFASWPDEIASALLEIRQSIFEVAFETEGVGRIQEALRWGEPAYLTRESRSGSTIRLAPAPEGSDQDFGVYFICTTGLIQTFQSLFGELFTYSGARALLFEVGEPLPTHELREALRHAMTYHL